uniref:diacylglycerol O-acyltransferase n=1 Tax=Noccaea caerulescens TaxID=107243 RepID=A0A1J3E527_NOCCA
MNKDGEGFIDDYVSRLTMIPLDRSRPLWDIHILNVKTSDAEAVVVVRCHHSLGDGMSLMSLLVASTRKTSDPEAFPTIPVIKRREDFLSHNLRNKGRLLRLIFTIYYGVKLIWNTIVDLVQFSATVLFLKDTKTPLEGSGGIQNNRKRLYHRTVSLDDIRLIKDALNMTINDVLLGVTQCALSRYLNGRYANTEVESEASTSNSNNLPGGIQLQAVVAVNLRQEIGIQPVESDFPAIRDSAGAKLGKPMLRSQASFRSQMS